MYYKCIYIYSFLFLWDIYVFPCDMCISLWDKHVDKCRPPLWGGPPLEGGRPCASKPFLATGGPGTGNPIKEWLQRLKGHDELHAGWSDANEPLRWIRYTVVFLKADVPLRLCAGLYGEHNELPLLSVLAKLLLAVFSCSISTSNISSAKTYSALSSFSHSMFYSPASPAEYNSSSSWTLRLDHALIQASLAFPCLNHLKSNVFQNEAVFKGPILFKV